MRNTFPDAFFKILLNFISDFVVVKKPGKSLMADYQLFALLFSNTYSALYYRKIFYLIFGTDKAFSIFAGVFPKSSFS